MIKSILSLFILSFSFIGQVMADGGSESGPSPYGQVVFLGGFILIFYFMLIRPQSKRHKEQKNLISSISQDDEVVTSGGIVGKVLKVTDQFLVVAIAEGIEVKVQKQAITTTLPKGTMKDI
jgi:preprotein translocase subunit YajC